MKEWEYLIIEIDEFNRKESGEAPHLARLGEDLRAVCDNFDSMGG